MKTVSIEKRASLPVTSSGSVKPTDTSTQKHFKDWPNETAFNAPDDLRKKIEVPITGKIPNYVAGALYRTGPGAYKVPTDKSKNGEFAVSHWFDGFTTVHRFDLEAGTDGISKASYNSYSQVDEAIEYARKNGKLEGITFGQKRDPCDTFYNKFKTSFKPSSRDGPNNSNIGVAIRASLPTENAKIKNLQGRATLTLTTDHNGTKQFDAETLEPLGVVRQTVLHPDLKGPLSAAHPARDPETGDIYNYNLDLGPVATYRVFRADAKTGKVDILATVASPSLPGAYLHSMFITTNFLILCVWPAFFSLSGISVLWNRNLVDAIAPFDSKARTNWLVVDRRHGRGVVKKFTSPAFFAFHTINAWEVPSPNEEGSVDIHCELAEFSSTEILHKFYYENFLSTGKSVAEYSDAKAMSRVAAGLARYKLPAVSLSGKAGKVGTAEEVLRIPNAGDLPRINPGFVMREHRYVYAVLWRGKSSFIDGLGKTDTRTKECRVWEREHHTPGEPIFVPRPGGTEEDDGAVLTVVHDGDKGTSYLLCLDARTMEEMGRVDVGRRVGVGFHGLHLPAAA
ncbi:carotenoid oxygenase [Myriangium duriaei CBS 260.36]|uniref:Carotenoid oxygenase n=1 Tax=Myriangium duriaei CBS 260.36 TaxID=1168546 RepID=A0A9P4MGR0_9PEZI|nr:carotenoid oxygenase [Myriangium duriaei CBS 260.36]